MTTVRTMPKGLKKNGKKAILRGKVKLYTELTLHNVAHLKTCQNLSFSLLLYAIQGLFLKLLIFRFIYLSVCDTATKKECKQLLVHVT